jgi:hypothetical protein
MKKIDKEINNLCSLSLSTEFSAYFKTDSRKAITRC